MTGKRDTMIGWDSESVVLNMHYEVEQVRDLLTRPAFLFLYEIAERMAELNIQLDNLVVVSHIEYRNKL